MDRYLLDTNHASLLYRQLPEIVRRFDSAIGEFFLCLPSIGELWFMVNNSTRVTENAARLTPFLDAFHHLNFSLAAAVEFGRIKAAARRSGRAFADVDAQIAAIAIVNDLTLLTDDADFAAVPAVRIENWIH